MTVPWRASRRPGAPALIPLAGALDALGRIGQAGETITDVAVADIVGSVGRATDFDRGFRPARGASRVRYQRWVRLVAAGDEPPPLDLVQLGEVHFVADGHHRLAALCADGRRWVTARVRRVCTIAYASCCLRAADLPTKAAERRRIEEEGAPDQIRLLGRGCAPPGA